MFLRGLWLILLVAVPTWSLAQTALEQTMVHFGAARDSLLIKQGQLEEERSISLAEVRQRGCDSTWLWHLAERSMVLRVELRAPPDTMLARNSAQLHTHAGSPPHGPIRPRCWEADPRLDAYCREAFRSTTHCTSVMRSAAHRHCRTTAGHTHLEAIGLLVHAH